ncbi:MAG: ribose-phosphate pyrophosphokinase [Acholeplasmataceae bacterium]
MNNHDKKAKLFTLSANKPLAEMIAKASGIPISQAEVIKFADGEITTNVENSVRGNHVFVVQPTSQPANDHLMEVLILTDALKRASAASITIIMPYFGYSRQDRKAKSRQPITAKLVANLITVSGADRVVCIDLHAAQIQGFFDIPIDNFSAAPFLATHFKKMKLDNIVVVSPDHGGVTRARMFATFFQAPLAIIDKRRPRHNEAEVMNIIGDVKDATCILFDDIIDTGGTLIAASDALTKAGAKEVYAAATHGVLTKDAPDRLQNSSLREVIITDTIFLDESKKRPKIKQLSIGSLLGAAITHILHDEPISQIFNKINEDLNE